MTQDLRQANEQAREAWNQNAAFWDERMGEGNDWVEVLTWPATLRLLGLKPGERVLDIACGNGLTSRRLAAMGAKVLAFDFSPKMIAHAQQRTEQYAERIEYRVLDATDESALLELGEQRFDVAVCHMALFDMAEVAPLIRALARMLCSGGRFVFSVLHPCFNSAHIVQVAEQEDADGDIVTRYGIKVYTYITPTIARGAAIAGQPRPHLYFHRPLQALLSACFDAGFVLDGLEEPTFPPDHPSGRNPLSFGANLHEIPPVLVARVRLLEQHSCEGPFVERCSSLFWAELGRGAR
jgi:2-polyprenyl-3-methyl-5-hydroxy-6-metoxy-1,4-benzoquinol methylase